MSSSRRGRGGRGGSSKNSISKELLKRSAAEAGLDDRHIKVLTDITRPELFPDFLWHSNGQYWDNSTTATTNGNASQDHSRIKREGNDASASATTIPTSTTGNSTLPQLPHNNRPASSMIALMNKQRELTSRMQSGPHFVRPNALVDIVRYSSSCNNNNNSGGTPFAAAAVRNERHPDTKVLRSMGSTTSSATLRNNNQVENPYGILASDARYFPLELLPHVTATRKHSSVLGATRRALTTTNALDHATLLQQSGTTSAAMLKLEELARQESGSFVHNHRPTTEMTNEDGDVPQTSTNNNAMKEEEAVLLDEDAVLLPDEEEDGEDYTTNYYNTDNESDENDNDDDGGEPTF